MCFFPCVSIFHIKNLVGGGFPGNDADGITFPQVAKSLGPTIDSLFPSNIRVIAEPGRFYVSSAFTLAVNIVARRVITPLNGEKYEKPEASFMCK